MRFFFYQGCLHRGLTRYYYSTAGRERACLVLLKKQRPQTSEACGWEREQGKGREEATRLLEWGLFRAKDE